MTTIEHNLTIPRNGLTRLLDQHQRLAAFLLTALVFMILHKIKGVAEFPWDAGGYWKLSAADLLFDFPKEIRGYFYPALLSPARFISDSIPVLGLLPYRIISSLIYGYFFAILVPAFYLQVFGGRVTFLRRMITPLLVAILFPGVIIYTLSDLPALALMIGASACALYSTNADSNVKRYAMLTLFGCSRLWRLQHSNHLPVSRRCIATVLGIFRLQQTQCASQIPGHSSFPAGCCYREHPAGCHQPEKPKLNVAYGDYDIAL